MKRKSLKKAAKAVEDENGSQEENGASSSEEPRQKKERRSKSRASKLTRSDSEESEITEQEAKLASDHSEDDDENQALSKLQNGHSSAKKGAKKKRGRKSKNPETETEAENGDETDPLAGNNDTDYEVEAILKDKVIDGIKHYLIRWKGYTEESDTWEPENAVECEHLIKAYNEKKKPSKKDKKNRKSGAEASDEDSWDENENFEVDRILDIYIHKDGKREFLVSWKGYPASDNSWEPEEHMGCPQLIEKFMSKVEKAKTFEDKKSNLRISPKRVNRWALSLGQARWRSSKRLRVKERVQYQDGE